MGVVLKGPRAISSPKPASLGKGLLAFDRQSGEVILLQMDETDDIFLPVFTAEDKLLTFLPSVLEASVVVDIKVIADPNEFLMSVAPEVRIAVDPHVTDDGTVRFEEVLRPLEPVNAIKKETN